MIEVRLTVEFSDWLSNLRDVVGAARIAKRIARVEQGNFGDHKALGDDVSELRLDFGPGYRVYYTRRGNVVVLLLCGGDKSTQVKDIERAKNMVKEVE